MVFVATRKRPLAPKAPIVVLTQYMKHYPTVFCQMLRKLEEGKGYGGGLSGRGKGLIRWLVGGIDVVVKSIRGSGLGGFPRR